MAAIAFLHAARFTSGALSGEIPPMAGFLMTVGIGALAVGVWRRRLWAVYALALYELLLFFGGVVVIVGPLLGLAASVALTGSPSALSPISVTDLPIRRIVITAVIVTPLAVFVAAFAARLAQIKLGLSEETANAYHGAITYVLWVIVFALAARKMPWSLETVLGAVAVSFLLEAIDVFVGSAVARQSPTSSALISLSATGMALITSGMIGEGLAVTLSPFQPGEWLRENRPDFLQQLKEYETSQAIIESSAGQESEATDKFRKIILSRAFFALCLRHTDTAEAYAQMMKAAEQIDTDLDEGISTLMRESFHTIKLLSERVGRQLPPLRAVEQVTFLCDQLREVNRTAGSSYLILNRRPTDSEASECDLICSEDGCNFIETDVLSKETVAGLDRHELVWRCPKHQKQSVEE